MGNRGDGGSRACVNKAGAVAIQHHQPHQLSLVATERGLKPHPNNYPNPTAKMNQKTYPMGSPDPQEEELDAEIRSIRAESTLRLRPIQSKQTKTQTQRVNRKIR
jgi:hypothetical protein